MGSSTIHGLGHILKTSHIVRAAWIAVVFAGFSFSGLLIYQSVDNWQRNDEPNSSAYHNLYCRLHRPSLRTNESAAVQSTTVRIRNMVNKMF